MKKLILSILFLAGCKAKTEVTENGPSPETTVTTDKKFRRWSAYETNLPKGVVTGGESTESGNWLSIEREDGISTVVKGVDPAVWGAVSKFDTIQ